MKRIAAAIVAAALAGCDGGTPSPRSAIAYWSFLRHTQTQPATVAYDTTDPGGNVDGPCAQSGVEYVTITDESGNVVNPELPQVPCVYQGVHGVQINGVPSGPHSWTFTGYRKDGVALYAATQGFTIGNATPVVDVVLDGIPDDLDVNAGFFSSAGAPAGATCAAAGVQFLGYTLLDGAGTKVAEAEVPCKDPPGLSFRTAAGSGLDRDTYTLRLVGYPDANPATPASYDDQRFPACTASTFDHAGGDVGASGWNVALYKLDPNQRPCP